ncbi:MAG: hypothetical protein KGN16_18670 [Burkholderiales bacterium]|nr:hypothetical protein [Burkholderiales bacterium]
MEALGAQRLLQCWDGARDEHPLRRALALLDAAWPEVGAARWGALPLGARDARLIALHEALFGTALETRVDCPACGAELETPLSTGELATPPAPADDPPPLVEDGIAVEWRLPTSDDLLAVLEADDDAADAAERLLARCVRAARRGDAALAPQELPEPLIERLQQAMAERDPGADLRIALACPACGQAFERRFDIGSHLFGALDDWTERLLDEVHALASAYGWSEAEILALPAARRRHYLARIQA